MKILQLIFIFFFITFSINFSQNNFNNEVVPIDKSRFTKGLPQDSISLRWQKLLNFTCDEVLNVWWNSIPDNTGNENQTKGNEGKYIDFGYLENNSKTGEFGRETKGGIRPAAQAAYSVAVALFTGAYDSSFTKVSNETALLRAATIIKSLAKDHLSIGGIEHPWGDQWQSAQWASKTAVTGWLLWDYFDDADKTNIRNMIEHEANRFINITPHAANENYKIDTHAEENGWDGTGIQTACALLPQHANYKAWLNKSFEYRLNALATPKDLHNEKIIEGRKVKDWIAGYNADTLGALGNHKAYPHPDYMAAPLRHTIEGAIFFRLGNQRVPEANKFNCNLIYKNFVDHVWNNESTIYKKDGSVYWPISIEEDRRFEFITFGIIDLGSQVLGYDEPALIKGNYWENKHTEKAVEMKLTSFIAASAYLLRWLEFQEGTGNSK